MLSQCYEENQNVLLCICDLFYYSFTTYFISCTRLSTRMFTFALSTTHIALKGILYLVRQFCIVCTEKRSEFVFIDPHYCLTEQQCLPFNLDVKLAKAGLTKISILRLKQKNRKWSLIGGKCINGRKLEPFREVCAGPHGQLFRWTCFLKNNNKNVIAENQAKNNRYKKK